MRLSSRNRVLILFAFLCLTMACQELIGSLKEISKLQQAIIKEYGEPGVHVNLNNSTYLIITFINSPLNAKSSDERAQRARLTAEFVKQHYPSIGTIGEIWVGFVKQETRYVLVTYSEEMGFFGFDRNAVPLRRSGKAPIMRAPDPYPTVVYSPALNQTDVSIMRLQLEGDLSEGLAMSPHFVVPGDVTGLRRSRVAPLTVGLDFASYSEAAQFPGETKVILSADDKVVYETTGKFSTSFMADGNFSEFLLLQIPYAAFRRMATGEKVTVGLGNKIYELDDSQRAGLLEMTRYVSE